MAKQKSNRPMLRCRNCEGTGERSMADELFDVLKLASETKGITAPIVCRKLKWKGNVTAMNNRLEDLRDLGLLRREKRIGKTWVYFKIKGMLFR